MKPAVPAARAKCLRARPKAESIAGMRWLILVTLGLAAACAGSTTPARSTARVDAEPEPAADSAPAAKATSIRGLLDENAEYYGYVDFERARSTALVASILQTFQLLRVAVSPSAPDPLAELKAKCGFDLLEAVREGTYSKAQGARNPVVVLALDVPPEGFLQCLKQFEPGLESITVAGHRGLGQGPVQLIPKGDLLVGGEQEDVLRILTSSERRSVHKNAAYVEVAGNFPNPVGARRLELSLEAVAGATRIRLDADAGSASQASALESQVRGMLQLVPEQTKAAPPEAQQALSTVMRRLEVARHEQMVTASLTLEDTMLAGMLTALAAYGVRTYLTAAKTAEARATIMAIALELRRYAEEHGRFPRSAPPVPKQIPHGVKYQSLDDEWGDKSWLALGFRIYEPQYYSYEFETSKDGKHVTVRAHGDLDGDGVQSRFELELVRQASGEVVSHEVIKEQDPSE